MTVFRTMDFSGSIGLLQSFYAKTLIGKVVRNSLTYLTVHKWSVGTFSSTWNSGPKWTTPSKTATSDRYSLVAPLPLHLVQLSLD